MKSLTILIPCRDEVRTIYESVLQAKKVLAELQMPGEILVIDNGSKDASATLAQLAGARVVSEDRPGYGWALRRGLHEAQCDAIVMLDADLSYPFSEIPQLLSLIEGGADLVIGNRLHGPIEKGAMPPLNRYLGTPVLSFLIRLLFGIPVSDCNGGLRIVRRNQEWLRRLTSEGMEIASEMIVLAAQNGAIYAELPISFYRDKRGRPPHLRRWQDGYRHLVVILGTWLQSVPRLHHEEID